MTAKPFGEILKQKSGSYLSNSRRIWFSASLAIIFISLNRIGMQYPAAEGKRVWMSSGLLLPVNLLKVIRVRGGGNHACDIPREDYTIFIPRNGRERTHRWFKSSNCCVDQALKIRLILSYDLSGMPGENYDGARFVHYARRLSMRSGHFRRYGQADGELIPSLVFTGNNRLDEGFALLVPIKSKIDLYGRAISGWKPLGRIRTLTKCEDGWLYTIDDQPALDMYLRYLGESLDQKEEATDVVLSENISLFHPWFVSWTTLIRY